MSHEAMPIRVFQFPYSMAVGGTEAWLVRVCRHLDRDHFRFSFGLESLGGEFESEIRRLGMEVHPIPRPLYVTLHPKVLDPLLRKTNSTHVVHTHCFSHGPMLRAAARAGIPCRISHIHSSEYLPPWSKPYHRLTMHISWYWARRYATHILACSWFAAEAILGKRARHDPRVEVMYPGVECSPFRSPKVDRDRLRAEAEIPPDALVIGHVGRLHQVKNHEFIISLAPEILRAVPNAYFAFVGDGPLRGRLQEMVAGRGLQDRFRFLGVRHDVPDVMRTLFDVFFFPSRHEALGQVVLQAQAAGLPVVCSTEIPEEAIVVPGLVCRLDLNRSKEEWVRAVREAIHSRAKIDSQACLEIIIKSDFNIVNAVKRLEDFYLKTQRRKHSWSEKRHTAYG